MASMSASVQDMRMTSIHTWSDLEDAAVHLIQSNGQLIYQVDKIVGTAAPLFVGRGNIPLCGRSADDVIKHLVLCEPSIMKDGSVRFIKVRWVSQLDSKVTVSSLQWAVSLVNDIVTTEGNPLLLGGHANIYVEGVKDNTYFMYKAHLISGNAPGAGTIEAKAIKHFNPAKVYKVADTWTRWDYEVERMLDQIDDTISAQEEKPQIKLDLRGRGAFGVSPTSVLKVQGSEIEDVRVHNCFTWAREQLSFAGIDLFGGEKTEDVSGSELPPLIQAPILKIDPSSLYSKEVVLVMLVSTLEDDVPVTDALDQRCIYRKLVDVTAAVHRSMGPCLWRASLIYRFVDDSLNSVRVAAETKIDYLDFGGVLENCHIPRTLIEVTERGKSPREIDVTDTIKFELFFRRTPWNRTLPEKYLIPLPVRNVNLEPTSEDLKEAPKTPIETEALKPYAEEPRSSKCVIS